MDTTHDVVPRSPARMMGKMTESTEISVAAHAYMHAFNYYTTIQMLICRRRRREKDYHMHGHRKKSTSTTRRKKKEDKASLG